MKAVVLAAGEGSRLRPLTKDKPKVLVEVKGKPILSYCFDSLTEINVDECIVVVGYLKNQVMEYYEDSYKDISITYTIQSDLKGPAHALLTAEDYITTNFLLMNGDTIFGTDLNSVIEKSELDDVDGVFLVERLNEGVLTDVCVTDEDGNVTSILTDPEDPPSNLTTTGVMTLPPDVFHACHFVQQQDSGIYDIYNAIEILIFSGSTIKTTILDGWRVNINTQEDIKEAECRLTS